MFFLDSFEGNNCEINIDEGYDHLCLKKLFNNDEINIFKYSGLKNFKIISVLSLLSFF